MSIAIQYQKELGELLANWYRHFGKVAPRRPYREDDEGGGAGAAQLLFEEHPLLAEQPTGAASDLTFITSDNKYSMGEAEKRVDEACPQLTKQLANVLSLGKKHIAAPSPYADR